MGHSLFNMGLNSPEHGEREFSKLARYRYHKTMKRFLIILVVSLSAGVLLVWLLSARKSVHQGSESRGEMLRSNTPSMVVSSNTAPTVGMTNAPEAVFVASEKRRSMSDRDRLAWLEQCGTVPDDADITDWLLAQKTSWWGKLIEPQKFWKDRVVWMDKSALDVAKRQGRGYPPMPYEDSSLPKYPNDDDVRWDSYEIEGPNIHFASSSKERAFWDKFIKTQPHPPDDLVREQYQVADQILVGRDYFENQGNPGRLTDKQLAEGEVVFKRRAEALGCPPEALTDEALLWAYVLRQREEYGRYVARSGSASSLSVSNFLARISIDQKFVTQPIAEEQFKVVNVWKIAYLQRLRREKVDESYINAYLKSWGLLPEAVFSGANQP